jgi:hypothetical protein
MPIQLNDLMLALQHGILPDRYNFDDPADVQRFQNDLASATQPNTSGITAGGIQQGSGYALNPATGQYEQAYAKAPNDPLQGDWTDFSFDPTGRQSLAGYAPGYYTDNGSTFGSLGQLARNPLAVFGATTGLGGMTAANAVTGNNVGQGAVMDLAGLGAGAGAAAAFPTLGGAGVAAAPAAGDAGAFLPGAAGAELGAGTAGDIGSFLPGAAGATTTGATAAGDVGAFLPGAAGAGGAAAATGAAAAGGSAAGGSVIPAAAAGAGGIGATKLSDVLSGNVNPLDNLTLGNLGTIGATAGSIYGNQQMADKYDALARDYMGLGAPSRSRYEASFAPGFDVSKMTGLEQAMDTSYQGLLRGLSTQGNPYGNPGGLAEAQKYITGNLVMPTLQNYRNQNAATGGFGAFSTAAPQAAGNSIAATGNTYADLGRGISNLVNPTPTLDDYFRRLATGRTTTGSLA